MKNKVEQAQVLIGDTIPEPRARRFISAVAKRAKQREHAKKEAKKRRKRNR